MNNKRSILYSSTIPFVKTLVAISSTIQHKSPIFQLLEPPTLHNGIEEISFHPPLLIRQRFIKILQKVASILVIHLAIIIYALVQSRPYHISSVKPIWDVVDFSVAAFHRDRLLVVRNGPV